MSQHETNPDNMIDKLLAGLREVEPPQGMQQRILHGARERAIGRRWTLQFPLRPTHSWVIASAAVGVIVLTTSWTIAHSHRPTQVSTKPPAHLSTVNAPITKVYVASAPVTAPRLSHELRRAATAKQAAPIESVNDQDALALSEMNAPSRLAPPMPLTEQEQLLMRMIDKRDPVELAMLDPKFRSLEEANSKAEFDRFFAPPPSPEVKPQTTASPNAKAEHP